MSFPELSELIPVVTDLSLGLGVDTKDRYCVIHLQRHPKKGVTKSYKSGYGNQHEPTWVFWTDDERPPTVSPGDRVTKNVFTREDSS